MIENLEIISLFSIPALRVRVQEYFKDEIWHLKKGSDINSAECIALIEYINKQVEIYMRNVIGLKSDNDYKVDDVAIVKSWEECNDHFSWTSGDIIAQGVMSLEVPDNLCNIAVYCFSGIREHIEESDVTETPYFQHSQLIPMAENELIIVPGDHNPDINNLNHKPGMFIVFNIKTK
jgi:hypothetical protein